MEQHWLYWIATGLAVGAASTGLLRAVRQAWLLPPALRRAERLWASGAPVAEVLKATERLAQASGEIGRRGLMVRAWVLFASGERGRAVGAAVMAHLASAPLWRRWPAIVCLLMKKWKPGRQEGALAKLVPGHPYFRWRLAASAFAADDAESDSLGWKMLLDCVPCAADDPVFLDDCLCAALARLELNLGGRVAVRSGPEARALLEKCSALLMNRHGDPRLPWDRGRLAAYLSKERRHSKVLALCGGLPHAYRSVDVWLTEARTWGQLGDLGCAWVAIDNAVKVHPRSYRLWMETYRIAMARRDGRAAHRSLEQASKFVYSQCPALERWEYDLARSEYFFWVEGDADAAWRHFEKVPEKIAAGAFPVFKARMLLSKGLFEEAYQLVSRMLESMPGDVDLQLMQSEAMAGMGAWEALLPHLDSFGEGPRARAVYWHLKGLANKHSDNMGQCREDFEQAAWLESCNVRYAIDAGLACIELGEYGRSEHHFRTALKLDPRNEDALLSMAESRRAHHDDASAKSFLRECLVHHPDCQKASEMLLRLEAN